MYNGLVKENNRKINGIPLLYLLGLYIAESIFDSILLSINVNLSYWQTILWTVGKLLTIVIIIILFKNRFKDLFKQIGKTSKTFLLLTILGFGIFYVFELGASYYSLLMDKIYNIGEPTNQEGIDSFFKSSGSILNYVLLFINVVILAPILEEFEFRELIFKAFPGCHYIIPLLISGLLFGLLHMQEFSLHELMYLPVYMLPGIGLAIVYHISGNNFISSAICHSILNCIAFIQIIQTL